MANIVPVTPERHATKRWRPQQNCGFAARYAMVPLAGLEAARVAVTMPLSFIEQSGSVSRKQIFERVPRDEPLSIGAVLTDLASSGFVYRTDAELLQAIGKLAASPGSASTSTHCQSPNAALRPLTPDGYRRRL